MSNILDAQELSATETRGFIDDNFLRGLGTNFTLENLYQEQDDIYTLGSEIDGR